jgi:hypothetical protein
MQSEANIHSNSKAMTHQKAGQTFPERFTRELEILLLGMQKLEVTSKIKN